MSYTYLFQSIIPGLNGKDFLSASEISFQSDKRFVTSYIASHSTYLPYYVIYSIALSSSFLRSSRSATTIALLPLMGSLWSVFSVSLSIRFARVSWVTTRPRPGNSHLDGVMG